MSRKAISRQIRGDSGQINATYARDILKRLLIDLSWASSRLEGNTYNRLETQNLIEFGHAAEGKDQREAQMILNHKSAIEMLVPEPDPLRLRYRHALIEVVSDIVHGGTPIDTKVIRKLAMPLVKQEDLGQFIAMVVNDLHYLHEGNVARYRLRLAEYQGWKKAVEQPTP